MDIIDARQTKTFALPEGTWTLKRLGLRERVQVGGRAGQLLGGPWDWAPAPMQATALMRATMELATVQAPPGWDWDTQADDSVLGTLYEQWTAWDDSFRPPVAGPAPDMGRGAGAEPAVLVPSDVQSPPQ